MTTKKRGRQSQADLAVVPLPAPRPDPPGELTDEQKAIWRTVVDHMPADWFRPETHAMLSAYCRHVCRERFLSRELDRFEADWLCAEDGPNRYNKLSAAAERESRAALALARSMRITQQSQQDPKSAFRQRRNMPSGPVPWEVD
jgi:hypothetical protein